ncbi:hypothetical protein Tco_0982531 [Tanacetum coccineum]
MSNMYEDPIYDEVGTSYDSNIPSEVQDHDYYSDNVDEYHQVHEMQSNVQHNYIVNSYDDYIVSSQVVMSSATSAVTYTSVYTDSEPGRAFWGADDEEISEGGIPRVIVLGYDGLPMQPVAPPSPDYIPGPEDPQTPPVPQDKMSGAMFHPEEGPEEYKDDEIEDGPVDYLMDGGDDGDDDDGNSSWDDADDEDEDDEDKEGEEEEHLAPADSAIDIPIDEPVFPPKGTELVIPPPYTDITFGARITVRPQASISLPPEAEVERLLAITTPSPSPPISLSPPSAGERLDRSMAPHAHSSPPPVPSPLLPSAGCPTQIQTLRITSTQPIIDAVTAALPSPPLPPLPPSLYIPSTLTGQESSTARPTRGRGIDYGFVSMVDAEERRQGGGGTELADSEDMNTGLEIQTHRDHVYAHETHLQAHQTQLQLQGTLIQTQHQAQAQMVETLRVIRDIRREMSDMQAELLALREQQGRARQPGPDARIPDHQDASGDA